MKGLQKVTANFLFVMILLGNSVASNAQDVSEANILEEQYCSMILEQLGEAGEIAVEDVVSMEIVETKNMQQSSVMALSNEVDNSGLEAVRFRVEEDDNISDIYAIPFYENNGEIANVTLSSTQSKPFEDSQFVYVLVTVTYYYYSASETNWAGPYYRPTLVKAKWSDSTGSKSVKHLYANFNNASHVITLANNSVGAIAKNASTVSQSNPVNGITYVGSVISMSSDTAYSMYFNGIDTYSYVYGYVTDSASKQYAFSFSVFDGSGLSVGY